MATATVTATATATAPMAMEKGEKAKLKMLMFPWLAHGHISPYVQLSKKLSTATIKRDDFDLEIYICSTPINLQSFKPSLSKHKSIKLIELHIPSSPELPPELHTTKNAPSHLFPVLFKAFQESSSSFSLIIDSLKPHLLLYDLFQPWASKIAASRGVPSVYFAPTSAVPFSYFHHVYTNNGDSTAFPFQSVVIPEIYEFAVQQRKQIETYLKDSDHDEFAFGNFARSTEIVLVKGCREIEGGYVDHLSTLCNKRVICLGPLMDLDDDDHKSSDDDEGETEKSILKWLSGKERDSTVYVSFGSECFLSGEQIAEIAKGLLLCEEVNFIWALRRPEGLPEGFLEKVGERGRVVEWAPQMKILGHGSVGGFVSHGGWNSITEGIYFGVPIVAIPMQYEQPINARVAVGAGAAVEVGRRGGVYAGEDVAAAIKKVVLEKPFSERMRERVKVLSDKIREQEEDELNQAIEELLRLICTKPNN